MYLRVDEPGADRERVELRLLVAQQLAHFDDSYFRHTVCRIIGRWPVGACAGEQRDVDLSSAPTEWPQLTHHHHLTQEVDLN